MGNTLKFTEAYIFDLQQYITPNRITALSENTQAQLKGQLRCPECRQAVLSIVHSGNGKIFFRTVPSSAHDESCSAKVTTKQKAKINTFYEDGENRFFVKSQLESLRRLKLLPSKPHKADIAQAVNFNESMKKATARSIQSHALFHKSLNSEFHDCDYDIYKLFYGNVRFDLMLKETWGFLRCYDAKKNKLLCSIKLSEQVYKNMDTTTVKKISTSDIEQKIFFAAKMERKGAYNNCTLIHSSFILMDDIGDDNLRFF